MPLRLNWDSKWVLGVNTQEIKHLGILKKVLYGYMRKGECSLWWKDI